MAGPFVVGSIGGLALVAGGLGPREGIATIGPGWSWLVSTAELLAAGGLLVLLTRESVPGTRLPVAWTTTAVILAIGAQIATAFLLDASHPSPVPPGDGARFAFACGVAVSVLAVVPLVLAGWLVTRRLPASAALCAVGSGVASVLAADAFWRLHCPYTSVEHFLAGHLAPALPVTTIALLALRAWTARRRRARRRRRT